jgi:hypothetical protein
MRRGVFRSFIYLVIGLALLLAAGSLDPNRASQARAETVCHAVVMPVETKISNDSLYGGIRDPR